MISPTPQARARSGFILLLSILAISACGKTVLFDSLDPDCFWHLRVAQQLEQEGIHPIVDKISFASNSTPWTPYSWLAELGMKWLWDRGGYQAAILTQGLMLAAIVVLLGLISREAVHAQLATRNAQVFSNNQQSASDSSLLYLPTILSTAICAFIAIPYLSFRPATFAMVLLGVCAYLIFRDRRLNEKSRAIWVVIPLTVLLANIHLFTAIIPLWIGGMLVGSWWEFRHPKSIDETPEHRRRLKRYSLLLVLTALGSGMTPMLIGAIKTAIYYGNDPMVASKIIAECQAFWFGSFGKISAVLVAFMFGCAIYNRKRLRAGEWLCLIGCTLLLFKIGRFASLFVFIAAPALTLTFPPLSDNTLARRPLILAMLTIVLFSSIHVATSIPRADLPMAAWLNRHGPEFNCYPCAAADFVESNVPRGNGRVIAEFNSGGYLAWRLGENYKVLLDGRTQVYPPTFWQQLYMRTDVQRMEYFKTCNADVAVLPVTRSLFHNSLAAIGWTTVYKDEFGEVMVPPADKPTVTTLEK